MAQRPPGGAGPCRQARPTGPAAGEPPLLVDPRRWGSLIGLADGMTFIASSSPVFGRLVSTPAWACGLSLVLAALFFDYVRPVPLGPLARPRPLALATYAGCVVGELALIASGTGLLTRTGHIDLRPALIATVVGLHFLPFAWRSGSGCSCSWVAPSWA